VAAGTYCGQCGRPRPVGQLAAAQLSVDSESAGDDLVGQPSAGQLAAVGDSVGGKLGGGESGGEHAACLQRAELEPPRYCPDCARRMVVQVDPIGWRAVCSQHGELHG
jgi:hypothetical protein